MTLQTTHRLRGVAVGAAVGDALGMPLEFELASPPDIGIHTTNVLEVIEKGESWEKAAFEVQHRYPDSAGNGSVMRSWPVALMCWHDGKLLDAWSRLSSQA